MTDFTPDIIEMVLVAGIPAVLLYIFRISRRGFKRKGKSPVRDLKSGQIPKKSIDDAVVVPVIIGK